MIRPVPRTVLVGAVLVAAAGASATTATAAQLSSQLATDASSNGAYALLADGSVLDTTTRETIVPARDGFTPVDLADRAAAALTSGPGGLYVRTPAAPAGTFVSIGTDGKGVPAASKAFLVRDGSAVIFQTTESPARIIERDLATGTSTVRLSGAGLLDASEDGRVITWQRQLPAINRPSGRPLPGDPTSAVTGSAVGYQVIGGAARVVDATTFRQRALNPLGCGNFVGAEIRQPLGLEVSQDGAVPGGRYSLVLHVSDTNPNYPGTRTERWLRLTDGDALRLAGSSSTSIGHVFTDPVSGAFAAIYDNHSSYPTYNSGNITDDAGGTGAGLDVTPAESTDTISLLTWALPINRGAGAIFNAAPRSNRIPSSWITAKAEPVGASTTPWTQLPRSGDQLDSSSVAIDAQWVICDGDPEAAELGTYASFFARQTGNSAGVVKVNLAPTGYLAAKSVTTTLSWGGAKLWTRTATRNGTITLPGILPNVRGFKLTTQVKLANGTVLTNQLPLTRTR